MTLQPGQTVGRYQIIEPLGVGGMATVYKAFQPSLEREVALKVLRPGFADDAEFFQRFQREARSIARLRHPNIVQVFDFEPIDGRYMLAMEFLEGGTLKERVTTLAAKGERLSHSETARIVGEVAAALSYGHEIGIIHRDVKPSNVMLASRDRAVVTDFGIAKIMGGEGQTQTGVGIGTPEYMAPEQGSGAGVDHRADIYSLGVMAYEMLTGRVPFIADTPLAIVLAHMRDPLPLPTAVDPTVPAAAEHVLMKALAKEAKDRYASATDFADALRIALIPPPPTAATVYAIPPLPAGAVTGSGVGAATATAMPAVTSRASRGIPRPALIGAVALAVLLLAGGAFALTRGTSPVAGALLFELDPSRADKQLIARGPGTLRPTPDAVELVLDPSRFVQYELVPAVYVADFDATMRLRLVSGSGRVGVYFHGAGDSDLQLTADTRGQLVLGRQESRGQPATSLATYSLGSALGKDLDLRIVAAGPTITVFADGKELGRSTSTQGRSGGIGILVGSYDTGVTAQVRSLRVSGTAVASPAGAAAPPPAAGAGAQSSTGPAVTLPSKGPLVVQVDLQSTAAVFGLSAQNQARAGADGLTLEARDANIGVRAPGAPPPGTYGDLVTEIRAASVLPTQTQYRILFTGGAQGATFVQVNLQPGGRVQIEIIRDEPSAGGNRQLATGFATATTPTVLVLRRGAQLAVFVNGQFAAGATDPQPQTGGIDLILQPIFGRPGTQEPATVNSVRFESWAIYRVGG